ncbi:lipid storage droplets surface-binding protein 1-like isoform X1 [Polistes fuscatus]|uniref:lipid storage droplets surface-binding protein 1-like isoform X1 n=1 Tax=Polistes fuscatus TaxID=30207 RepID=UPI001CA9BA74|nr:lipid storage droplets surface-binding protein 1-like isoform X1 [Polistes fuscatus]XP_043499173.1 lipid storage droplets surface-binding protein 1-like isoform X1 [Polistes fuscatus]XP_043499174.1 lipid storage droplets surface-binding protein 1-like isoform X1 [Polistes fuscatus]
MAPSNKIQINSDLLQFESITKLSNLPIVESSIYIAGHVYKRIKNANVLMNWSLDAAETSLSLAAASAKPAIFTFNGPITTIDQLLCKGIDIVEQRVPAVHIPPQHMYWYTREYVANKILRPVLLRAGTMKQIGSHAASVAVDTLDSALTMADQYVDHYLPDDPADKTVDEVDTKQAVSKTTRTIQHGARFSRKLQRRLTRRTLAEARALKEQGTECIHVFLYVIELIARDPKLALHKAKELWATLSLPEPENQARPTTLEQLFVLLTRESARRIVHLVNGAASLAARTPRRIGKLLIRISRRLLTLTDATLKAVSIIGTEETTQTQQMSMMLRSVVRKLGTNTNRLLVRTASGTTCLSSKHEGCNDCNNDGIKKNNGNRNKDRNRKSNNDNSYRNNSDKYDVKVEPSTRSSTEPQQPHVDDFRSSGKRYRVTKQNLETVSSGFLSPSGNEKLLDYAPRSTAHRNVITTTTSSSSSSTSSSSSSLSCSSTSSRKRVNSKRS